MNIYRSYFICILLYLTWNIYIYILKVYIVYIYRIYSIHIVYISNTYSINIVLI